MATSNAQSSPSPNFLFCWQRLLLNEGGYTVDNGGETMWGVTKAVARANGYMGDMKQLPQSFAQQIAYSQYWLPNGCDLLPLSIAFQVLDTAYNGGYPIIWLQQIVGVKADGKMGPLTAAAVAKMGLWEVLAKFNAKRLRYMANCHNTAANGGWMNRIAGNLAQGEWK